MVIKATIGDKALMNEVFMKCGAQEFIFVERCVVVAARAARPLLTPRSSWFYFGFLFGLVQTVVWYYYQAVWVLPLAGFLCGCVSFPLASLSLSLSRNPDVFPPLSSWATNALALKCIFRPLNPVPVCGGWWVLQGLFIKRQAEVSKVFAKVIAHRFVTAERMCVRTGTPPGVPFALTPSPSFLFFGSGAGGKKCSRATAGTCSRSGCIRRHASSRKT